MDEQIQTILIIASILIIALLVVIVSVLIANKITDAKKINIAHNYLDKHNIKTLDDISQHVLTTRNYAILSFELLKFIDKNLTDLINVNKPCEDPTIKVLSKEQHDEIHNINKIKLREKIIKQVKQETQTRGGNK